MLADFARGARTFNATQAAFCAALRAKQFYPALRPDRVSLPAPDFSLPVADDALRAVGGGVTEANCSRASLAVALCVGAPCFDDPTAAGPLNVTCLCPIGPAGTDGGDALALTPPDMGHFGGCASYALDGGRCALQGNPGLRGSAMWEWDVAAVAAMATAARATDAAICRDWFGDDARVVHGSFKSAVDDADDDAPS